MKKLILFFWMTVSYPQELPWFALEQINRKIRILGVVAIAYFTVGVGGSLGLLYGFPASLFAWGLLLFNVVKLLVACWIYRSVNWQKNGWWRSKEAP